MLRIVSKYSVSLFLYLSLLLLTHFRWFLYECTTSSIFVSSCHWHHCGGQIRQMQQQLSQVPYMAAADIFVSIFYHVMMKLEPPSKESLFPLTCIYQLCLIWQPTHTRAHTETHTCTHAHTRHMAQLFLELCWLILNWCVYNNTWALAIIWAI